MSIKITIPNSSSDVLTFGSGNTPTAAQIAGIDSGSSNGQLALYTTASGTSTERVRINASGNVGIGTSSPRAGYNLTVGAGGTGATNGTINLDGSNASAQGSGIRFARNSTATGYIGTASWLVGGTSSDLVFSASSAGTEAMRIDSSGNLLVGTTTSLGLITANSTATTNIMVLKDTGTTYGSGSWYIGFHNSSGATAGAIQHTAVTTVNYATTSDARLKTDKGIATDTSVIDNIVIHDFEWKEDGRIDRGVFAQEAHEIKPFAVGVGDDEVTESGQLKNPWNVDYSKFVPDLIVHAQQLKKQVQEQQAIITSLTDRITALENK